VRFSPLSCRAEACRRARRAGAAGRSDARVRRDARGGPGARNPARTARFLTDSAVQQPNQVVDRPVTTSGYRQPSRRAENLADATRRAPGGDCQPSWQLVQPRPSRESGTGRLPLARRSGARRATRPRTLTQPTEKQQESRLSQPRSPHIRETGRMLGPRDRGQPGQPALRPRARPRSHLSRRARALIRGRVRARLLRRARRRPRLAGHSPGRTLIRPVLAACLRAS
jgi:hypothetical protein